MATHARWRKRAIVAGVVGLVGLGVAAVLPVFCGLPLTRRSIVEQLVNPVQVKEIRRDGLLTADGRLVVLPSIAEVPVGDAVFAGALSRGIEIVPDGAVIGLVDVHHWCGNDPVDTHIGRVDLSALAFHLGAKPTAELSRFLDGWQPERIHERIDPGDYGAIRVLAEMMKMSRSTAETVAR